MQTTQRSSKPLKPLKPSRPSTRKASSVSKTPRKPRTSKSPSRDAKKSSKRRTSTQKGGMNPSARRSPPRISSRSHSRSPSPRRSPPQKKGLAARIGDLTRKIFNKKTLGLIGATSAVVAYIKNKEKVDEFTAITMAQNKDYFMHILRKMRLSDTQNQNVQSNHGLVFSQGNSNQQSQTHSLVLPPTQPPTRPPSNAPLKLRKGRFTKSGTTNVIT